MLSAGPAQHFCQHPSSPFLPGFFLKLAHFSASFQQPFWARSIGHCGQQQNTTTMLSPVRCCSPCCCCCFFRRPRCCCWFTTAAIVIFLFMLLLASSDRFSTHSTPIIERRAPVVNDAITSNETLAAARNAFLIGHLFAEYEEEERRKASEVEHEGKHRDGSNFKPSGANAEEEAGLYGELMGRGEKAHEGIRGIGQERGAIIPEPIQPQQVPFGPETNGQEEKAAKPATNNVKEEEINNNNDDDEEEEEGKEDIEPIKPVNEPTKMSERHSGKEQPQQNADEDVGQDAPISVSGPNAEQQDPFDQTEQQQQTQQQEEHPAASTASTVDSQKLTTTEDTEDATNPFVFPPTIPSHEANGENIHPGWLRALFFTAMSTGIGFFLLMLLVGLVGRVEGGAHPGNPVILVEEQQRQQPQPSARRIGRPGDARVVPIIEEELPRPSGTGH